MSFPIPYHREDELLRTKSPLQRSQSQNPTQYPNSYPDQTRQDGISSTHSDPSKPSPIPDPQRRHLVFPDPVAFRYVLKFGWSQYWYPS